VTPTGIHGPQYQPVAINDSGQIVGIPSQGAHPASSSFLASGGQISSLTCFGPIAISDSGLILGQRGGPTYDSLEGIVYNPATGSTQVLPSIPNGLQTWPRAINNSGDVVGSIQISRNGSLSTEYYSHPLLFKNGAVIDLGTLGGTSGDASAINNSGQIVGWAKTANNATVHAFSYNNCTILDLGTLPGDVASFARGINSAGQIVGDSSGTYADRGFLYGNGVMRNLNDLISPSSGWTITSAIAINALGQILAYGTGAGNGDEVLLSPSNLPAPTPPDYPSTAITPEPTSLALYVLAVAALAVKCQASQWRRRPRTAGGQ
jgi:probable HAF family extracellular repeat protein